MNRPGFGLRSRLDAKETDGERTESSNDGIVRASETPGGAKEFGTSRAAKQQRDRSGGWRDLCYLYSMLPSSLAVTRRAFLHRLAFAAPALPWMARAVANGSSPRRVRFGLIADIHPDVMPDGLERVRAFVAAMEAARPDFVLHLGDFCSPNGSWQRYWDAWNTCTLPRYSVLGNHDTDGGYSPEQSAAFYGMPARHYAFNAGPLRGLVLDGNEAGGKARGYKRFLGASQLAWLERELHATDRPVALFIHQPFHDNHAGCLENSATVRTVVEQAQSARPGRVVGVFSGHLHLDFECVVNGVRYMGINSAAYWWLDTAAARRETYPHAVHQAYPHLKSVAAYRDPLWAQVTVDLDRNELLLEGRRTEWVGPDPWARGEVVAWSRDQLHPAISDRKLRLETRTQ